MDINKHIPRAYKTAIKRGFFPKCPNCDSEEIISFVVYKYKNKNHCPDCNGSGVNQNIPISKLIMDVIEEVAEARKAFRLGKRVNGLSSVNEKYTDILYVYYYEKYYMDTFESELADIIIVILSICGYYGIELNDYGFIETIPIDHYLSLIAYHISNIENDLIGAIDEIYTLLMSLCKQENIDIEKHIELKMKYNELREI